MTNSTNKLIRLQLTRFFRELMLELAAVADEDGLPGPVLAKLSRRLHTVWQEFIHEDRVEREDATGRRLGTHRVNDMWRRLMESVDAAAEEDKS